MARADATTASRESATRFGLPVEPEVSISSGSAAGAASQSASRPVISSAVPETGRRLLTRRSISGAC